MKEELFQELMDSIREAGAVLRGEAEPSRVFEVRPPDARTIREKSKLSQRQFAHMLGISVRTLRNWEQGRRKPEGAARVLLYVAEKHPDAIWDSIPLATQTQGFRRKKASAL